MHIDNFFFFFGPSWVADIQQYISYTILCAVCVE